MLNRPEWLDVVLLEDLSLDYLAALFHEPLSLRFYGKWTHVPAHGLIGCSVNQLERCIVVEVHPRRDHTCRRAHGALGAKDRAVLPTLRAHKRSLLVLVVY